MRPQFTLPSSVLEGYVYAIVNKVTGRRYAGKSAPLLIRRWATHLRSLEAGKHHCREFQADWDAFGEYQFDWVILEMAPKDQLVDRERLWTTKFISESIGVYNAFPEACAWCTAPFVPRAKTHVYCSPAHAILGKAKKGLVYGRVDITLPDGSSSRHHPT